MSSLRRSSPATIAETVGAVTEQTVTTIAARRVHCETEMPDERLAQDETALHSTLRSFIRRFRNEILAASRARMQAQKINGTVYSHPVGLHGHGAGPLIGLWDYQTGVPGRGDAKVIPSMWYSIELQATTPVPEWGGQAVRMAQEEDVIIGADGKVRWALKRQDRLFLVK